MRPDVKSEAKPRRSGDNEASHPPSVIRFKSHRRPRQDAALQPQQLEISPLFLTLASFRRFECKLGCVELIFKSGF